MRVRKEPDTVLRSSLTLKLGAKVKSLYLFLRKRLKGIATS